MDDNAVVPPGQQGTNPVGPTPPAGGIPLDQNALGSMPSSQPAAPQPAQQVPISQPAPQPTVQQTPPQPESSKITLEDLYGPSKPQELTQAVPQPMPQPVVETPQTPIPENPQVSVTPVVEAQRRSVEPAVPEATQPASPVASSLEAMQPEKPVTVDEPQHNNGGFHLPSILRFVIGGLLILLVLLLIWGVSSLIFSGNKGNQKVTLTYWGLWEDKNVMQPILDDFHQQHPNITVTYIEQDPKDYTKRLLTRMQEGTGPDIFRLHNTWVYPLRSVLLPLPTSVIDVKQLQTNYPPVVASDMVSSGAVYGLPLEMDALSLFVNTDIFTHAGASIPTTWDNFITVAKALTVKDPNGHIQTAGAALGTYDNVAHAPDIISLLLLQNGANLDKLNGSTNATDALSFYTGFAQGDGNVWDSTLDNSLLAFERGKVAMYFGYSYDIFAIQAANPSLKFTVHAVPHLPGRDMTVASYWVEGASIKSTHQKEALEFMQYLAQKDTQTKLYTQEAKTRAFGELYAQSDLASGLSQNAQIAPIVAQFKTAQSSFFVDSTNYDEYNGALNQYLANAINSMEKDTSVDSAAATLAQGVVQVRNNFAPSTK